MSILWALFFSLSESHGMTVPIIIQHQINFFFTTLICSWHDVKKNSKTCICHVARDSRAFLQNRYLSQNCTCCEGIISEYANTNDRPVLYLILRCLLCLISELYIFEMFAFLNVLSIWMKVANGLITIDQ